MANEAITMKVLLVKYHPDEKGNYVFGAPDGVPGDELEVPFSVGARLVAAGYAEATPERDPGPKAKSK